MGIIEESIGKKFNSLIVERFVGYKDTPSKRQVPLVECVCKCGKKKNVSLWDVRCGKTKTCGVNHPHFEDRSIPAFNRIYNQSYKKRAESKGIEFSITKEDFRRLSQDRCHYCNALPTGDSHYSVCKTGKGEGASMKSGQFISQFVYNGLDRKDSSKGYTLDNVVPCCGICNHAKHTLDYEEFIAWLDRIVEFRTILS